MKTGSIIFYGAVDSIVIEIYILFHVSLRAVLINGFLAQQVNMASGVERKFLSYG